MGIALGEFGRHFSVAQRYYCWFRWSHRKNSVLDRHKSSPFALAPSHSWVNFNCFGFFASTSNCSFVSVNYASSDSPSVGAQRLNASRVFSVVPAAFLVIAFLLPVAGIPKALADGSATVAHSSFVPCWYPILYHVGTRSQGNRVKNELTAKTPDFLFLRARITDLGSMPALEMHPLRVIFDCFHCKHRNIAPEIRSPDYPGLELSLRPRESCGVCAGIWMIHCFVCTESLAQGQRSVFDEAQKRLGPAWHLGRLCAGQPPESDEWAMRPAGKSLSHAAIIRLVASDARDLESSQTSGHAVLNFTWGVVGRKIGVERFRRESVRRFHKSSEQCFEGKTATGCPVHLNHWQIVTEDRNRGLNCRHCRYWQTEALCHDRISPALPRAAQKLETKGAKHSLAILKGVFNGSCFLPAQIRLIGLQTVNRMVQQ